MKELAEAEANRCECLIPDVQYYISRTQTWLNEEKKKTESCAAYSSIYYLNI
jgi:hypothetical protein